MKINITRYYEVLIKSIMLKRDAIYESLVPKTITNGIRSNSSILVFETLSI